MEWLIAVAIRRADSDDSYDHFEGLHAAGKPLPGDRDRARDHAESDTRLLRAVTTSAPGLIEQAAGDPGAEVAARPGEVLDVAVYVDDSQAVLEVWVAVGRRRPDGSFLAGELVLAVFAIFKEAVGAEMWDHEQGDWPTRTLEWFEVARLYVA